MSILRLHIASDDRAALEQAVAVLEHPNWITRMAGLAGKPVELIGNLTPKHISGLVARASQKALMAALRLARTTLTAKPLWRSELLRKVAAAGSGAVGGTFGLAMLPVELPISTALILRSIAEIARHEGEDLSKPEAALACVQVFASYSPCHLLVCRAPNHSVWIPTTPDPISVVLSRGCPANKVVWDKRWYEPEPVLHPAALLVP
jgi:hypothetical protein